MSECDMSECGTCQGRGVVVCVDCVAIGCDDFHPGGVECPDCGGSGQADHHPETET